MDRQLAELIVEYRLTHNAMAKAENCLNLAYKYQKQTVDKVSRQGFNWSCDIRDKTRNVVPMTDYLGIVTILDAMQLTACNQAARRFDHLIAKYDTLHDTLALQVASLYRRIQAIDWRTPALYLQDF